MEKIEVEAFLDLQKAVFNKFSPSEEEFSWRTLKRDNLEAEQKLKTLSLEDVKKMIERAILTNMIMEVEVIKKNKEDKSVLVQVIRPIGFCALQESKATKYDPSEKEFITLFGDPHIVRFLNNLHLYEIKGLIRSYDINDNNPLDYYLNLQDLKIGDRLNALVKRIDSDLTVRMSLNNSTISQSRQVFPPFVTPGFIKLGYTLQKEQEERDLENPNLAKILNTASLNQYECEINNPGGYKQLLSEWEIDEGTSFDLNQNTNLFQTAKFSYRSVRAAQNEGWAFESYSQGLEHAKNQRYTEAIECYENSLSLREDFVDAIIAKGCALANMGSLSLALKVLEKALELDPKNEEANEYQALVLKKYEKEKDIMRKVDKLEKQKESKFVVKNQRNIETEKFIISDNDDDDFKPPTKRSYHQQESQLDSDKRSDRHSHHKKKH